MDNIKWYKARLIVKTFIQKETIDYYKTFSLVSKKHSLRIIIASITYFDLELHQMDVKITFLNKNIDKIVYMTQSKSFCTNKNSHLVSKLKIHI